MSIEQPYLRSKEILDSLTDNQKYQLAVESELDGSRPGDSTVLDKMLGEAARKIWGDNEGLGKKPLGAEEIFSALSENLKTIVQENKAYRSR